MWLARTILSYVNLPGSIFVFPRARSRLLWRAYDFVDFPDGVGLLVAPEQDDPAGCPDKGSHLLEVHRGAGDELGHVVLWSSFVCDFVSSNDNANKPVP